jgi:hypothetical protein
VGFETHHHSRRAAEDLRLRPHGHHLPRKTLLLLLSFKQVPRWIRNGPTREVRLYYVDVMTRIEMVKVVCSIVVLSAGKTVETDSPRGSVGRQWVAIPTFYLKHETCNLLGRGRGGGGNTEKCRYFRW